MGPTHQQVANPKSQTPTLAKFPNPIQPSAPLGPGGPLPASAPAAALHHPCALLPDRPWPASAPAAAQPGPRAPRAYSRSTPSARRRPPLPPPLGPGRQLKRGPAVALGGAP